MGGYKCGNPPQVHFGCLRTETSAPDVKAREENAGNLFAGSQLEVSCLLFIFTFKSQNDASLHTILCLTSKRIFREFLAIFWKCFQGLRGLVVRREITKFCPTTSLKK